VLYWEILVLLCGIGLSTVLSIYAHFKITQIAASDISGRIQELNDALGEAITMVGAGGQPENPLLAILSKVLEKQIDNPITAHIVEKDESGKFVKKIQ
tara:strand:- start:76 stop:369 length:294 start_codon:yes stop_codon:yes gene_type:complete